MEAKIEDLKGLLALMIELEEYEVCAQIRDIIERFERVNGNG